MSGWQNEVYINPTGRFVIGGPMGDAGLTGARYRRHLRWLQPGTGGGAFSGGSPKWIARFNYVLATASRRSRSITFSPCWRGQTTQLTRAGAAVAVFDSDLHFPSGRRKSLLLALRISARRCVRRWASWIGMGHQFFGFIAGEPKHQPGRPLHRYPRPMRCPEIAASPCT